jgi:hypothetical protein
LLGSLLIHAAGAARPQITVYKTSTCGCCAKWVDHMRANGFDATVHDVPSTAPYRQKFGVPEQLMSCHTAVVSGYAVEGHVPAADVQRLLKSKRKYRGIALPGMPIGSPGMEQGPRQDAYSVLSFDRKGRITEFQRYPAK